MSQSVCYGTSAIVCNYSFSHVWLFVTPWAVARHHGQWLMRGGKILRWMEHWVQLFLQLTTFTECTRHWVQHFTSIFSLTSYNYSEALWLAAFYRWGNEGLARLDLPKVSQLVSGRVMIQTQAAHVQISCSQSSWINRVWWWVTLSGHEKGEGRIHMPPLFFIQLSVI